MDVIPSAMDGAFGAENKSCLASMKTALKTSGLNPIIMPLYFMNVNVRENRRVFLCRMISQ